MTNLARDTHPLRLGLASLSDLPADIKRPNYDRKALNPGIIHVGLGNFHRAHQAWYLHRLMQAGRAHDWAIVGAGVRAGDADMRERLLAQDCLTTLIELDPTGSSAEIIGSMVNFLPVTSGNGQLINAMSDPAIRIVSMTVTEGGYYRDANGAFDGAHPDLLHDVAVPEAPMTVFGAIVAACGARRKAGHGPFTCLSCDNLQNNGDIFRQTVVGLARLLDTDLAVWIEQNVTFPNSMVDCIVPATGALELDLVRSFGINDAAPVTHENFRQWVIEDRFSAGRPPLEEVGVTLTQDVHAYESMKIRTLNGGHQLLANIGEILSVETIAGCMRHPHVRGFFEKVERSEILPHVTPVPEKSPEDYLELIINRFANPKIKDTTRRVAFDGSSRHPGFLLPVVREGLDKGSSISGLALAEAFWARMCDGTREDGGLIEANDPNWVQLQKAAKAARAQPRVWLEQTHIYADLASNSRFADAFEGWLSHIWQHGCVSAAEAYLAAD